MLNPTPYNSPKIARVRWTRGLASADAVLGTHRWVRNANWDEDLDLDVKREGSGWTGIYVRANTWSLAACIEHLERWATPEAIGELDRSLTTAPVEVQVRSAKGRTTESWFGDAADRVQAQRQAPAGSVIVLKPRAGDRKLLAQLQAARAERVARWTALVAELRTPAPEIVRDPAVRPDVLQFTVLDHGVAVGGLLATSVEWSALPPGSVRRGEEPMFLACNDDVQKAVSHYGEGMVWTVPKSTLWPRMRNRGLGRALYHALYAALQGLNKDFPIFLVPHACLANNRGTFGCTSDDAWRVWKRFRSEFPSIGAVVVVPAANSGPRERSDRASPRPRGPSTPEGGSAATLRARPRERSDRARSPWRLR